MLKFFEEKSDSLLPETEACDEHRQSEWTENN